MIFLSKIIRLQIMLIYVIVNKITHPKLLLNLANTE